MGELGLSELCPFTELRLYLTACQDHLRRHLADNVPNDEECREQIVVRPGKVQVFLHARDVCICYEMVSFFLRNKAHLEMYLLTLAQSSSRTKYPIVAQLLYHRDSRLVGH